MLGAPGTQAHRRALEKRIAREQHERPALAAVEVVGDLRQNGLLVVIRLVRWVGHLANQMQLDLAPVVERAAQLQRLASVQTKPILEVPESLLAANRERGAAQDDRRHLL